jgi:hypothetical protein
LKDENRQLKAKLMALVILSIEVVQRLACFFSPPNDVPTARFKFVDTITSSGNNGQRNSYKRLVPPAGVTRQFLARIT